jgi:hypothetical protein
MNGPDWASGCKNCKYGVVEAMPLTRVADLTTERIIQMEDGLIKFCVCAAGTCYEANLKNRRQILIEQARKRPDMAHYGNRNTHLDLENARHAMRAMQTAPTVHAANEPVKEMA